MKMHRWAPWLVAGCLGCEGYSLSVDNKEPFEPLPVYTEWWSDTETCSGREGDLLAIDWYLASGITGDAVVARGVWTPPNDIILVRGYEEDELTVRHEMLHSLLGGNSEHTAPEWVSCRLLPT